MKILVVSDVDGCLTDGGMYYDASGKALKRFSAGDHEGLKLLKKNNIDVMFITADRVGLPITKSRLKDMSNSNVYLVPEVDRLEFMDKYKKEYDYVVFFGDGLGDVQVVKNNKCDIFICPSQARVEVQSHAYYITAYPGGSGAFLDMAIWLCEHLKRIYNIDIKSLY